MGSIFINYDMGVPQIGCTDCGKCNSIMGMSLCKIKSRGCCHYFPDFSLIDIQRMAVLEGGHSALELILANSGTTVNSYNIYCKGEFDETAYNKYVLTGNIMETGSIKDHTIFFRTCPFVQPGSGCILPPRFRTTVCNFFICAEILEHPDLQEYFKVLISERSLYSRWVYRENNILQHILMENSINLISNFSACIELLAEINQSSYEFPPLKAISYNSTFPIAN